MNKLRRLSLNITVPSILFLVFFVLQGSVFWFEYQQAQKKLYISSEQDIKGVAGQLQTALSNSLMRLEKAQAQALISTAALNENIKTIAVIDSTQQIVLSNNFREKFMFAKLQLKQYEGKYLERVIEKNEIVVMYHQQSQELIVYTPLQMISKGNNLNRKFNGVIFIRYSLANAYIELAHDALFLLIKFSLILLFSILLLIYFINRLMVSPLKRIIESINTADVTNVVSIAKSGTGEIGLLEDKLSNLFSDVSQNMNQLASDEERWLYAINGSQNGVWDWDIKNDRIYYSHRWKEILGFQDQQLSEDIIEWEKRVHPDDIFIAQRDIADHFSGRNAFFENTQRVMCFNGEYKWILSRAQVVAWDTEGNPLRMVGTITDLSSFQKIHERISNEAQFDDVTNLPNRLQLISHISKENVRLQNNRLSGSLVFINCAQYQIVNELEGHNKGDELLFSIANRLQQFCSGPDFVAHLQGSEFAIILTDLHHRREQVQQIVLNYVQRLEAVLSLPFVMNEKELVLNFAYGIAIFPNPHSGPQDILRQSAMAMKSAQNSQLENIHFFSKCIEDKISRRHSLQREIRNGLDNEEFSLFFQPRVDVNGNLVAAEALSRWYREDQGWTNPGDFIPVAEDSDLIIRLGDWVILQTFLELKNWIKQGLPKTFKTLSMNVSPKQLIQTNFVKDIKQHLKETGINANLIEIEITESILVSNAEIIIQKLNELRDLGFSFAIDDFGTGYSSFSYLSIMPVSALKIDQSFILNLLQDKNQQVIVSAIIDMGKSLYLDVVVEGVENIDQFNFLVAKGCTQFQGYYIGAPLNAESFRKRLISNDFKIE